MNEDKIRAYNEGIEAIAKAADYLASCGLLTMTGSLPPIVMWICPQSKEKVEEILSLFS